jgi:hypothetical protein
MHFMFAGGMHFEKKLWEFYPNRQQGSFISSRLLSRGKDVRFLQAKQLSTACFKGSFLSWLIRSLGLLGAVAASLLAISVASHIVENSRN